MHRVSPTGGPVRRMACLLAAAVLALAPGLPVAAAEAPEVGDNPAQERHMMELASELRCLQCQNQTLADSEAPLAVDLRQEIREMIAKGQSDVQIKAYLAARYGDFVFYRPPMKPKTLVLWFGPAVLLVGGLLALVLVLRRRNARLASEAQAGAGELSADEAARARQLLGADAEEGHLS